MSAGRRAVPVFAWVLEHDLDKRAPKAAGRARRGAANRARRGAAAVEWLRAIGEACTVAELPLERADLLHAIHERIVVAGRQIVSVRLTPAAYTHGLALLLPEVLMASSGRPRAPTEFRPPRD